MNRFWTRLEAKDDTVRNRRSSGDHSRREWASPALGLIIACVVGIPIAISILLLTEFNILLDANESLDVQTVDLKLSELDSGNSPESSPPLFLKEEIEPLQPVEDTGFSETSNLDEYEIYTVVNGDTLSLIAKRFDISIDAIATFNDIANRDALRIGQQLSIPPEDYIPPSEPSRLLP